MIIENAILFSHFDSRGGSTLMFGDTPTNLIKKYGALFNLGTDAENELVAMADYEGIVNVELPDGTDLEGEMLEAYGGEHNAYIANVTYDGLHWFEDNSTIYLIKAEEEDAIDDEDAPFIEVPPVEHEKGRRLMRVSDQLGENAFGLVIDTGL